MDEPELGPDGDLLPPMVSAAVIPNIVKAFEAGAYDVYSAKQSRRVVDLVDLVSVYTTKDNVNFRSIVRAVVELFLRHVDATAGLVKAASGPESGQPPAFDPASRTALATFARRRIKLMRNLLMWRRFSSSEVADLLRKIVVEILLPCLTKCWDSGGQQLAEEAVRVVPTGVLPPGRCALAAGAVLPIVKQCQCHVACGIEALNEMISPLSYLPPSYFDDLDGLDVRVIPSRGVCGSSGEGLPGPRPDTSTHMLSRFTSRYQAWSTY